LVQGCRKQPEISVVAFDEKEDSIEVQYLNGDIGEYDQDSWYNSTFDYIEDPEDWTALLTTLRTMTWVIPTRMNTANPDDIDIEDYLDN